MCRMGPVRAHYGMFTGTAHLSMLLSGSFLYPLAGLLQCKSTTMCICFQLGLKNISMRSVCSCKCEAMPKIAAELTPSMQYDHMAIPQAMSLMAVWGLIEYEHMARLSHTWPFPLALVPSPQGDNHFLMSLYITVYGCGGGLSKRQGRGDHWQQWDHKGDMVSIYHPFSRLWNYVISKVFATVNVN